MDLNCHETARGPGRPVEILLVEDSPSDVFLTRRTLALSKLRNEIHVAEDGVQALAFLRRHAPFENVPRPDIVFLDLNLPGKHGGEVLREMRLDAGFCTLPVVVVTGSAEEEQILRAYDLDVSSYIRKPIDLPQLLRAIENLPGFWMTLMTVDSDLGCLPPR